MGHSVLVIDDSETIREQIIQTLQQTPLFDHIFEASDGIEGFKQVMVRPITLIICDLEMPRMDGFKFLGLMQSRDDLKDIPVIMLTSREDREMKIRGLEQGAADYVTKPFDPGELLARVKVQIKLRSLQDELKKTNARLQELINTDPLTMLFNRRYMMTTLEKEFQRSFRKGSPLSIVIADIDHFKRVNDTYGHQQGDVVLQRTASLAKEGLRVYDVAARYGGEEFVIILPETRHEEACAVAERLRQRVEATTFSPPLDTVRLTISMGVASYPWIDIDTVDTLIRCADSALYRAKESGRNRVVSYQAMYPLPQ
ncbi:MAG: diguanylate cyclase [Desulfuromonadia bacterium]